ncbi:hypothetical protein G3I19_26365 [Streptomyces sp. SID10853]|uniref:hypothetical protein n=1 Tax=Streptomyces sp. SID10853 TaxID=2706028 RepID=UPI0013C27513|nr:hypothetical protein [Streptomyces sp. SID10853]NDZ81994.1 hypothetical protein [Streptomyces sp. SID10853]
MTWPSYPYEARVRGPLQRDSVTGSPGFAWTKSMRRGSRPPPVPRTALLDGG